VPQLRRIEHVLHGAEAVTRDLDTLARLLTRIEAESFTAPRLRGLQQRLSSDRSDFDGSSLRRNLPQRSASSAIRSLHQLVEIHEWQHNNVFLAVSLPFLMGTHLAWAIEAWRARHGASIRQWLAAVGEFEALASLSGVIDSSTRPIRFPEIRGAG
jgi:hypothetical protein